MSQRAWTLALVCLVAVGPLTVACSDPAQLGQGEMCVRSVQCMPGLACINGTCGNDTTVLEGGMVPPTDAGNAVDAMVMVDAGPPGVDAGMFDAGPPGVDAGMRDAGPPGVDAGPPMMDAGPPMMDAGPPMMDAGPPMMDAGPPMVDAGP